MLSIWSSPNSSTWTRRLNPPCIDPLLHFGISAFLSVYSSFTFSIKKKNVTHWRVSKCWKHLLIGSEQHSWGKVLMSTSKFLHLENAKLCDKRNCICNLWNIRHWFVDRKWHGPKSSFLLSWSIILVCIIVRKPEWGRGRGWQEEGTDG